jgi:phosphatidylserine/phosphatidylglycerophosphate/cardiolipin synthase-like enzyme
VAETVRTGLIDVHTLMDGGQTAATVASRVADFLSRATTSLDLALYDFDLSPPVAEPVVSAIRTAAARGVRVRFVYNVDHPGALPIPPPSRTPLPLVESLGCPAKPIPGVPDLMHHKYVVRDGSSVWSGSTNWTDDSWTREENVVVTVDSRDVAAAFTKDFEDLWTSGGVGDSGSFTAVPLDVGGVTVRAWFAPGRGRRLAQRIASAIGHAERRVRIASPVITAGPILGSLVDLAVSKAADLAGVFDATQMHEVLEQWHDDSLAGWKAPAVRSLLAIAPFGGKRSTPYGPGRIHDYMHAKVVAADDTVFIGSYNLSGAGRENAENVLEIADPSLADLIASFVDDLRERYPRVTEP